MLLHVLNHELVTASAANAATIGGFLVLTLGSANRVYNGFSINALSASPACLSVCLFVCLSVCLTICCSVSLSLCVVSWWCVFCLSFCW